MRRGDRYKRAPAPNNPQPPGLPALASPLSRFSYSSVFFFLPLSRRFGTKCAGCSQGISPSDLVRKARNKVFHLNCFTCMVCNKQLSTGEELYIIDENKFVCKEDYLNSPSLKEGSLNSGTSGSARRTARGRIPPLVSAAAAAVEGLPVPPAGPGRSVGSGGRRAAPRSQPDPPTPVIRGGRDLE